METVVLLWFVALTVICITAFIFLFDRKRKRNYPPGPPAFPIFGNLLQIPQNICTLTTFSQWSKKYGPVFSLKMGRYDCVVIGNPVIIRQAFNDPLLSGRPNNRVFRSLSGGDYGILTVDGETWTEQRKFTLRHLRDFGFGKNQMETLILDEAKELIEAFKIDEGKSITLGRRFNLAILNSLWLIVTGSRLNHDDLELNAILEDYFKQLDEVFVKGVISFLPELTWIAPEWTGWNALNRAIDNAAKFFKGIIQEHEQTLSEDNPRDYIDSYLLEVKKAKDSQSSFYKESGINNLLAIIGDLFAAGAETTSTTMNWACLYLANFPEIQKKFQEEIQQVVGQSRLPSLADKSNMPYTEALMMEILRKSSIAGLGLFHTAIQNAKIAGYDISKDTMIIPNFHEAHHDIKFWENPDEFNPERFLSPDKKTLMKNDALMPFSVGKRACLGESLAKDEFFLFLTTIFQRFDIELDTA